MSCCIRFAGTLLRMFASVFIKDVVLSFAFLAVSLSGGQDACPLPKGEGELLEFGIQSSTSHFFCRYTLRIQQCFIRLSPRLCTQPSTRRLSVEPRLLGHTSWKYPWLPQWARLCSALLLIWGAASSWAYPLLSTVRWAGPAYAVTFYLGRSFTINSWQHLSWALALLQPGTKFGLTLDFLCVHR